MELLLLPFRLIYRGLVWFANSPRTLEEMAARQGVVLPEPARPTLQVRPGDRRRRR
ncbi:hypothetical protein [Micromonospora sp. NPDC049282]|uniref:hypothetical protein n=1 Tax=Micromonospora sp. NPDC049282 TaxID=3364269 RepID=UPI0037192F35